MARKVSPSFFVSDSVLFIGYSKRHIAFCAGVREAFEANGTKVYPVNPSAGDYGITVYESVEAVPASPELAYVVTSASKSALVLDALAAKGVKRVLFNSTMSANASVLARCAELGMESAVACPMMALGGGLHRFHGWLSGVQKATVRGSGVKQS